MKADYLTSDPATLPLRRAILLYENTNYYNGGAPHCVATVHNVEEGTMQPGKPLSREGIEQLSVALLNGETKTTQQQAGKLSALLPPNLLYISPTRIVWFCPAARRPIFFDTHGKDRKLDAMTGRLVTHPPLVFVHTTNAQFRVFALAQNKRPTEDTPLFTAPYFNIYKNGALCEGTAQMTRLVHPSVIKECEEKFFSSRFTHSNIHGVASSRHPKGHTGLWQEMRKAKRLPARYLTPANLTLAQAAVLSKVEALA